MNSSRKSILFIAAWLSTLLLGALVYLPGLPGSFIFDDIGSIADNAAIRLKVLNSAGLLHAILSAPVGGLLRPISTLSFVLDAHFFGVSPEPFKITNICIHLAVGILLWYLARELLRAYRPYLDKTQDDRTIAWLSLAASALWLVHPLNLTSVLYTVQRDNSLSALFAVAAILGYMVGRRTPGVRGRLLIWLLTPLCTALGMLCKENAALTPVFILVIEFTLLGFRGADGKHAREVHWFFIAFLLLPMLAACALVALKPAPFFSGYFLRDFTLYERLLSECRILLDYLRWVFVPDLRQLALFHDDIAPSRGLLDPITTLLSLITVVTLLVTAFAVRRRTPLFSFGLLWFFAGQLLESTVLPLELAFEHRNYLPLFGLILGIVGTLYPMAADRGRAALVKVLIVTCALLLALTTAVRSSDWQNELTFAQSESSHHPLSARALAELQWAYVTYIVTTKDVRLIPLALDAAGRSKAADPGSINQDIGLAYMYANLHDLSQARSHLQDVAIAVGMAAPTSTLQLALQTLLVMNGKDYQPLYTDMAPIFRNALQNPKLTSNACYGADISNTFAIFQRQIGEVPGALNAMHKAITLCPKNIQMRTNYIDALLDYRDTRDAGPELDALRETRDLRYLPEIHHLQEEYAAETAAQRKN